MIFPDDIPPLASDPACNACGKPWQQHQGITGTCNNLQAALLALKAAAIQSYAIHESLRKIVEHIEGPESPTSP